ncbi:MAG TPA: hypothetical protein VFM45_09855 [Anaeromyxobacteraceae bacterium]|nr:hypothetical protein [Anaeromyxobacteraceae bacterium]
MRATGPGSAFWRGVAWLQEGRRALGFALVTAILAGSARFLTGLDRVVADPFHEGEFFGPLAAIVFPGAGFTPLTIHGAMDVVPGLLAWHIDPANLIVNTRILTGALSLAAAILMVLVAAVLARSRRGTEGYVFLLAVAGIGGRFLVGIKDLVLLGAILAFLLGQERRGRVPDALVQVAYGVLVSLGLFWSAERGLGGTVALGIATLVLATRAPRYLLSLAVFVVTTLGISALGGFLSLRAYVGNLEVLVRTSAQWRYPPHVPTAHLVAIATLALGAGALLVVLAARDPRGDRARLANAVLLVLLTAAYYRMSTNRADWGHVDQGMAILFVDLTFWFGVRGPEARGRLDRWVITFLALLLAVAGIQSGRMHVDFLALWLVYLAGCTWGGKAEVLRTLVPPVVAGAAAAAVALVVLEAATGGYDWVRVVSSGVPRDEDLAPAGVRFAAGELSRAEVPCVFDMANHGIVNLLVRKPSCSRFSYPVYADRSYEGELIQALRDRAPAAVVYSTTADSYAIDARPMNARFPALDAELRTGWPVVRCGDGYCVRVRTDR